MLSVGFVAPVNGVQPNMPNEISCEAELLLYKFEQRLMEFEPIAPRVEVQIPEGGLQSLLGDARPIDTSHLETMYRYDAMGYRYTVLTDEAMEVLLEDIRRYVYESITPEFEALAQALGDEVRFMTAQANAHWDRVVSEMAPEFARLGLEIQPMNLGNNVYLNTLHQMTAALYSRVDGLSNWEVTEKWFQGGLSATEAVRLFPTNTQRPREQDAFRHFAWNHRLARQLGTARARIASNNLEYSDLVVRFHRLPHRTDAEALQSRWAITSIAMQSLANFNSMFGDDHVMDFWNNRAGVDSMNSALQTSFQTAWNNNRLIRQGIDTYVTAARRADMYWSGWWRHPSLQPV